MIMMIIATPHPFGAVLTNLTSPALAQNIGNGGQPLDRHVMINLSWWQGVFFPL
jgi:hypothetical protein